MRNRIQLSALVVLLPSVLWACGPGTTNMIPPRFGDNDPDRNAEVVRRIQGAKAPPSRALIAGVHEAPAEVFLYDLTAGKLLWTQPAAGIQAAPIIAGEHVVTHEGRRIVGRHVDTGAEAFSMDDEHLFLAGAAGSGSTTVVAVTTGIGAQARSILSVFKGGQKERVVLGHSVGAPAVFAGMIFLPWDNQNASVFELGTLQEIARLRLVDEMISRAFSRDGQVYLGHNGLFRFSQSIASGSREKADFYRPAARELPGNPAFLQDAYRKPPPIDGAAHRVRLVWSPDTSGGNLGLAHDRLYLVYYRVVFALEANGSGIHWAQVMDKDVVGAESTDKGILVTDEEGKATLLGWQDGAVLWSRDLGHKVKAATVSANHLPGGATGTRTETLTDQLVEVAGLLDTRMVSARELAIGWLTERSDAEVTGHLIGLCEDQRAPNSVRAKACSALAERDNGAEEVMFALTRHASFLDGTTAPPVGPLSLAAVKMGKAEALPLMLEHLADPHTPERDLPALVTALGSLGSRKVIEPLEDFVRLYHAERWDDFLGQSLVLAIHAIRDIQGEKARPFFESLAADPMGMDDVRNAANASVIFLDEAKAKAVAAKAEKAKKENQPTDGTTAPGDVGAGDEKQEDKEGTAPAATEARRIDSASLRAILKPVQAKLQACVDQAKENARIIIILEGDGSVSKVSVAPTNLQACMAPLVTTCDFPANPTDDRRQLIYNVSRSD
ncbi:MAG: hypothetical protein KC416_03340 [Myxococcales bacterium]|nr:hypothetical protein [Myxococcales bacterium]